MILGYLTFGLAGAVAWYLFQQRRTLNRDETQHHLASLMIAVASGQRSESELRAFVDAHSRSPYDRSSRINHAVRLAATRTDSALQERVIAVATAVHRG